MRGADVILEGANTYLSYYSVEQPAPTVDFNHDVSLVETNFEFPDGSPAKREHLMVVLENLQGIYIRATYWSSSFTTR